MKKHIDLHLKLNGKRLYTRDSVKYLQIKNEENLVWHHLVNNVAAKLTKANAILSTMRYFVDLKTS